MQQYRQWVLENPAAAKRAEDFARGLSYLIPSGQGTDSSGVLSETVYALINLVSMYNDRLLASQAESVTESDDAVLDGARWALTTLGSVDVVVEMVGTLSNGRAGKWKAVTAVEVLRAACKFFVLLRSGKRQLINGGQFERQLPRAPEEAADAPQPPGGSRDAPLAMPAVRWVKGARSGICLPIPPSISPVLSIKDDLEASARPLRMAGEVLHIVRPLVFLAVRRVFGGRSWLPLLTSAATDIASWRFSQAAELVGCGVSPFPSSLTRGLPSLLAGRATVGEGRGLTQDMMEAAGRLPGAPLFKAIVWAMDKLSDIERTWSSEEAAEMTRRKRLWAMYLLRSPLFFVVTKPCADATVFLTSWIPLLGMLVAYLRDMLCYFQRHYFYTSASR